MMAHSNQSKKIAEACDAIAHFGFQEEKVKAALSRLLKLCNDDRKFIGEENYKRVIDILMKENPEGAKKAKLGLDGGQEDYLDVEYEETGSPLKRSSKGEYYQASSSVVNFPNRRAKTLHPRPAPDKETSPSEFPQAVDSVSGVSNLSHFDIASFADEEVKISLICSSSGNSYFRQRSLDAVLGKVEDECRRIYGIRDPNFSLMKVTEKVCKYFLEVDIDFNSERKIMNDNHQGNSKLQSSHYQNNVEGVNNASGKKIKVGRHGMELEAVLHKKYPIYLKDIARGEENVQIPLVNESSSLELPNFMYIKNNMVDKDAHIDFSLARISDESSCPNCDGDCLSSALPCACAGETGGEFAYTREGLLNKAFLDECIAMCWDPKRKYRFYCEICPLENNLQLAGRQIKPCKGHLTRKFIKECWRKCGCNKKCGNRIVQRGIQVALQLFATPEGKGWGVRSVHPLKKGTFVCEYAGEIVTNQELDKRNNERAAKEEKHTYPVLLDADWGSERILRDEEALCLDATEFGNVGRFINHRCKDANLIEIPVEVETPDHHYYRIAFFTTRDIEPMEELTWDYGIQFQDKHHPIKAFKCKCGSSRCRNKKKIY